jgi:hypothetical protein
VSNKTKPEERFIYRVGGMYLTVLAAKSVCDIYYPNVYSGLIFIPCGFAVVQFTFQLNKERKRGITTWRKFWAGLNELR